MIPDELRRHIGLVRSLSKPGGPFDKDGPNATLRNPEWYRSNGTPKAIRRAVSARIKSVVLERTPNARVEGRALVLAGPPGAGKSRVADFVLGEDRAHYVNIDADEFKLLLLHQALADGSYESWIQPSEVRDLEAKGEHFYPLELASLVHEESSRLAMELRSDVINSGTNIIIDTVLSDREKAARLGEQLAVAGYQVTVINVEVPFEVSELRIVNRWMNAIQKADAGKGEALGGRWVPSAYTRPLFDTAHGRSKSQDAAAGLAESCPTVFRFERHYTSVEEFRAASREGREARPTCEVSKVRSIAGGPLLDALSE